MGAIEIQRPQEIAGGSKGGEENYKAHKDQPWAMG